MNIEQQFLDGLQQEEHSLGFDVETTDGVPEVKMQTKAFIRISELLKSPNIAWSVYFSSPFYVPWGPLWWFIPNALGCFVFGITLRSNPEYDVPQFLFISHHYLFLSIVGWLIIAINSVYFTLNDRKLTSEHVKGKHLTLEEKRDRFEKIKRNESKNIFWDILFKIGIYVLLAWFLIVSDYLSLRIIAAMAIIDVIAFIAILAFARKMPPGRNALSLYECSEGEQSAVQGKEMTPTAANGA